MTHCEKYLQYMLPKAVNLINQRILKRQTTQKEYAKRQFTQTQIWMANRHVTRCSTSLTKLTWILYHYNIVNSYIHSTLLPYSDFKSPTVAKLLSLIKFHLSKFYTSVPLYCKVSLKSCLHLFPICFFLFSLKPTSVTKLFLSWLWRTFTSLNPMRIIIPLLIWPISSIWHNPPPSPFQNNLFSWLSLLVF